MKIADFRFQISICFMLSMKTLKSIYEKIEMNWNNLWWYFQNVWEWSHKNFSYFNGKIKYCDEYIQSLKQLRKDNCFNIDFESGIEKFNEKNWDVMSFWFWLVFIDTYMVFNHYNDIHVLNMNFSLFFINFSGFILWIKLMRSFFPTWSEKI